MSRRRGSGTSDGVQAWKVEQASRQAALAGGCPARLVPFQPYHQPLPPTFQCGDGLLSHLLRAALGSHRHTGGRLSGPTDAVLVDGLLQLQRGGGGEPAAALSTGWQACRQACPCRSAGAAHKAQAAACACRHPFTHLHHGKGGHGAVARPHHHHRQLAHKGHPPAGGHRVEQEAASELELL